MSKSTSTQSITTLPASPTDERRSRMIKYSVAMGIRTLCVIALIFVQGWWVVVMVVAALVLPYVAVVVANVGARPAAVPQVTHPGAIVPVILPPADAGTSSAPAASPAGHRPPQDS
jgi:hypothetical protein